MHRLVLLIQQVSSTIRDLSSGPSIMGRAVGEGLRNYYKAKIEELEIQARDKQHNLRRLEAQRNELNTRGRL